MINSDIIKPMLHQALNLLAEISRYGGAEHAPRIWQDYTEIRSKILKDLNLRETSYNLRIIGALYGASTIPGDSSGKGDCSSLSDFMPPNSIPSSNEFVTSTDKQQNHIDFLCDKLFSLAKNSYGGRPVNKYHTLRFAKKDKAPVTDVFLKLNIENQPYTRFLIQIILYGKYGTVAQVIQELDYIKPPEIEWLFILYNSSLVDEKEQAAKWLRNTELQFIDLFLWWEESHILSNLFCVNHL